MNSIEAFLSQLPPDHEYLVLQDGKPLYQHLNPYHWQVNTSNNTWTLLAPHSTLFCMHRGKGYFALELKEHTHLHLTEWFDSATELSLEYTLKDNATLHHVLLDHTEPNLHHKRVATVHLAQNSSMNSYSVLQGTQNNHTQSTIRLTAPNATFNLAASLLLPARTQLNMVTNVQHLHPNTKSTQSFRAIVQATAQSLVTGHILVAPKAFESTAQLDHKALLLQEGAKAHVQPQLEIYADTVQCAHGASISQLEPGSLFFLQSRGLTRNTATHLLLEGFLNQTLPKVTLPFLTELLATQLDTVVGEANAGSSRVA